METQASSAINSLRTTCGPLLINVNQSFYCKLFTFHYNKSKEEERDLPPIKMIKRHLVVGKRSRLRILQAGLRTGLFCLDLIKWEIQRSIINFTIASASLLCACYCYSLLESIYMHAMLPLNEKHLGRYTQVEFCYIHAMASELCS